MDYSWIIAAIGFILITPGKKHIMYDSSLAFLLSIQNRMSSK